MRVVGHTKVWPASVVELFDFTSCVVLRGGGGGGWGEEGGEGG